MQLALHMTNNNIDYRLRIALKRSVADLRLAYLSELAPRAGQGASESVGAQIAGSNLHMQIKSRLAQPCLHNACMWCRSAESCWDHLAI